MRFLPHAERQTDVYSMKKVIASAVQRHKILRKRMWIQWHRTPDTDRLVRS